MAKKQPTQKTRGQEQAERPDRLDVDALGGREDGTVALTRHVSEFDNDYGKSSLFYVKHRGTIYAWFIRHGSGNHKRLIKRFGENPKKWQGKDVDVEVKEFSGEDGRTVQYLAIV